MPPLFFNPPIFFDPPKQTPEMRPAPSGHDAWARYHPNPALSNSVKGGSTRLDNQLSGTGGSKALQQVLNQFGIGIMGSEQAQLAFSFLEQTHSRV